MLFTAADFFFHLHTLTLSNWLIFVIFLHTSWKLQW